ncbi:hypothetical protein EHQ92_01400 [Leptospira biflexa]|jgi:hypothetical protein|uniref:hypothetical protein n=1 Tax=Leptospira biflexa TaxID=172 RepID=UPI001090C29E|nr:hypothetical protein [Leptospira biflexa]TGM46607.1 hypothetical protein EHQ92_01400 [Leptospira biflexa]TGM50930.1 hypothetical protein EHQ88_11685 [Leptospira biflexa]TGM56203.1 hypothetical protein EHQ91_15075 [Leptospira biflexa]
MSVFAYKKQFLSLTSPKSIPTGQFQIQWLGPKWFQWLAKTGLQFLHFRNWWGKSFHGQSEAINLFQKPGESHLEKKFKMLVSMETSPIDGKTSLFLRYTKDAPFPWPYFVDEFRVLKDGELLGMSYPRFLPSFALPFLIQNRSVGL